MQAVTPVTVIGGYLGCGKTTLVNHMLRHANGVRLAVLVNDFGELPIDEDLIEARDNDIISLSGGCICCSYGDDLSQSLLQLQTQSPSPDHIFIEASGVALPGAIASSISLLRAFQLQGIVVLADATSVQIASVQKYIGDTIRRQLNDADLIVLNKIDLLSKQHVEQVTQWLAKHYVHAPSIGTAYSKIDLQILLSNKRIEKTIDNMPVAQEIHDASSVFSTFRLRIAQPVNARVLAANLADKRCGLVRTKGFVIDQDNVQKTIQTVGRRWSVTTAPEGVENGLVCIATSTDLSEKKILSFCNLDETVLF